MSMFTQLILLLMVGLLLMASEVSTADEPINYDEDKIPPYTLPDPLVMQDGAKVADAEAWRAKRRPELLELFREHVYGRLPAPPSTMHFEVAETDESALDGRATRKRVVIHLGPGADGPKIPFVCYLPNGVSGPVPVFVGMHLFDVAAPYPAAARHVGIDKKGKPEGDVPEFFELLPGEKIIEKILARGYGIATLTAAEFAPDDKDTYDESVLAMFEPDRVKRPADCGKAIAAWAWGLSRALDYFETDPAVDARQVIVVGHSRMGKTALWAGAQDERFAIVISNNSGCGGAALSKRDYGETVARINRVFPHWFCDNFQKYNANEADIPVDQHELIALAAPRPVYVASAEDDRWADPRGEFLATKAAEPVYLLLGLPGLGVDAPPLNETIGGQIGYHVRSGGHALADYDWLRYLDFADGHFEDGP